MIGIVVELTKGSGLFFSLFPNFSFILSPSAVPSGEYYGEKLRGAGLRSIECYYCFGLILLYGTLVGRPLTGRATPSSGVPLPVVMTYRFKV